VLSIGRWTKCLSYLPFNLVPELEHGLVSSPDHITVTENTEYEKGVIRPERIS
jgi:hypothetical protein